jgi:co-chaperonin GroES (HSP10)
MSSGTKAKPKIKIHSGTPYQVGEDELIIIKASDILAKIG